MEAKKKNKSEKVLSILALILACVSLAIGFTAYATDLVIEKEPDLDPNRNEFKVGFSTGNKILKIGHVNPVILKSSNDLASPKASRAEVVGTEVRNIHVDFTNPGVAVSYTFYVHNYGEYNAYLNDIVFQNIERFRKPKVCIAQDRSLQSSVDEACKYIKLGIINYNYSEAIQYSSVINIQNSKLVKGDHNRIDVIVSYNDGAPKVNGKFSVYFGDIKLNYGIND